MRAVTMIRALWRRYRWWHRHQWGAWYQVPMVTLYRGVRFYSVGQESRCGVCHLRRLRDISA